MSLRQASTLPDKQTMRQNRETICISYDDHGNQQLSSADQNVGTSDGCGSAGTTYYGPNDDDLKAHDEDEDVTEPPRRPRPSECCGMRCPNCVWIQYEEKLKKYRKHRMKMLLEMRTRSSNMGDHLRTTSENEPVPLPRRVDSVQLNGSKRVYYGLSGFPGGNSEQNSNLKSQSSENKSKRVYYGLQGFPKEQTDPIQGNGRKRVYLGLSGFQNGNHEQKLHDKNDSPGVNPEQLLDKSQKLTNTLSSEHADTRSWINGKAQHYFSKAVDYNLEGSKRVSFKLKGF